MHTRAVALLAAVALVGGGYWIGSTGPSATQDTEAQGIEIHGNWTIDIHEPDGTLVASHAFANALTDTGDEVIPWLFFEEPVIGDAPPEEPGGMNLPIWYVLAGDRGDEANPTPTPPCTTRFGDVAQTQGGYYGGDPDAVGCLLATADPSAGTPDGELTQRLPNLEWGEDPFSGDPASNIGVAQLEGSFVASQTGVIDAVETSIRLGVILEPGTARYADILRFTAADVGPYDVEAEQTVTIKVDFTFS